MDNIKTLRPWQVKALEKGFQNSLSNGPVLNFPVLFSSVKVHKVEVAGKSPPDVLLIAAMTNAAIRLKNKHLSLFSLLNLLLRQEP